MSEKKIIIIISIFILMTFSALSWREMKLQTGTYRNGWWGVYFNDPKGTGLDFTIENESKAQKFSWKVLSEDGNAILQGSENIGSGEKKEISLSPMNTPGNQKVTIEVSGNNDEKKDIYKILK